MGAYEPLLSTVGWTIFIFILCPIAIYTISRLVFGAYFKAKEKHEKEGGVNNGKI